MIKIVKACVILHNFVRDRDGFIVDDTTSITGLEDLPQDANIRGGMTANTIRNTLCKCFMTNAGNVPWQMSRI
ncbi:hypothetical protein NQ314_009704 [Rhamnusium bicolor]|uniref:Transposase n=1 Tax=Rhamnusium bicolor TaxID=1586634 RepID=A0AAV8XY03_9CUCU|nr:hypothetical protein NQ314_009704 [Rhamnusium bicolor]